MSIYITGDTHLPIDVHKLSNREWIEQKDLTPNDYLIICGDFGGVWDNSNEEKYWIKWLINKPYTILFVDGNHENFDLLNQYNIEMFNGGKVHRIANNIYHLMRGQIFNIDGTKIFTMGGASSHDKMTRKEGRSWWKEELPNDSEFQEAMKNLELHNWEVDLVITHCAPDSIQKDLAYWYEHDIITNFLEIISKGLKFKKWYFGHYHTDRILYDKFIAIYNIIEKYTN